MSVRVVAALLVVAGLALPLPRAGAALRPRRGAAPRGRRRGARARRSLIQSRVIGETPVPGNDWAKYVLYADEIARHGSLLIDNPYWMLGVPFREDPGVPGALRRAPGDDGRARRRAAAGDRAVRARADRGASTRSARSLWGGLAGVVAACLWAALPLGYTLLGWHGLANAAALALLALLLLYLADFARARLDPAAAVGAGPPMVALAAAHRLSFGIAVLSAGADGRRGLAHRARSAARSLRERSRSRSAPRCSSGAGVAYDLIERNSTLRRHAGPRPRTWRPRSTSTCWSAT